MIINLLRLIAVLVAAVMLGNWFQKELKSAKRNGLPWYRPYISPPGLLIILSILLFPLLARFLK